MISALTIEGLAVSRGDRLLFDSLTFSVEAGQAAALIGRNGAGKTSLLRAIAGFIAPQSGEIRFSGSEGRLDAEDARSGGLHFLSHYDGLKPGRTAHEEIEFFGRWTGGSAEGVAHAIEALELEPLLDLEVRKLSAGQRRRTAMARLIAAPRALWLLDEPLAPLDAGRRDRVGKLMADHLQRGGLIVAAVHDLLPIDARQIEIGGAA